MLKDFLGHPQTDTAGRFIDHHHNVKVFLSVFHNLHLEALEQSLVKLVRYRVSAPMSSQTTQVVTTM